MSKRRKPFMSRWPKTVNTIGIAIEGACVTPRARAIMVRNADLFDLLRRGAMRDKPDFDRLTKAILIAENLREFPLAREHGETFEQAFDALRGVADARQARGSDRFVATAQQLDAIRVALLVHKQQLIAASASEIEAAEKRLRAQQMSIQGRKAA